MKTNAGFDFLAPVYDFLAGIVFGKSIKQSQLCFLDTIPPNSKILMLGGGTGWILEEISNRIPSSTVWYIELSKGMMDKAQHRKVNNRIYFIQGTEADIPQEAKVDVIITNFYLDLFSDERLRKIIPTIQTHTHSSSIWIATDFVRLSWWHGWMLKMMYAFFRFVCNIEANRLPDWGNQLAQGGWKEVQSQPRYGSFIKSSMFERKT